VITNISGDEALYAAINLLSGMKNVGQILVEEFFRGVTYRFFVAGEETLAILKFDYPNVVGDGKSTIEELIKEKNSLTKSKIKIGDVIKLNLAALKYSLESVLKKGTQLVLSYDSHPSLGAGAVDVTGLVDPQYKELAVQVATSMGLQICGVDMMIDHKGDYRIIEVNTAPAMATHLAPQYGNPIPVYRHVMEVMLKKTTIKDGNEFFPDMAYYHM
jgi:glutamate--cysteine ligase